MKTTHRLLRFLARFRSVACLSACSCFLAGCATTKITTTAPDGTGTVTETTAPAAGAIEAGSHAVDTVVDGHSRK